MYPIMDTGFVTYDFLPLSLSFLDYSSNAIAEMNDFFFLLKCNH